MNMKRNQAMRPAGTDHSKTTAGWHNLQDCAICLKGFLPQVYERKMREREQAKARGERLLPADLVKTRGRGMPFPKTNSQTPKNPSVVGAF